jgi:hypothetical protein
VQAEGGLETPAHRIHEQVNTAPGLKVVMYDKAHHYVCISRPKLMGQKNNAVQS